MLIYYHIICTPIYCTMSVPCLYLQLDLQRKTHVSGTVYNLVHTVQIIGAGDIHSQVSDDSVVKAIAPSHHRDLQRVNKFWRENFWNYRGKCEKIPGKFTSWPLAQAACTVLLLHTLITDCTTSTTFNCTITWPLYNSIYNDHSLSSQSLFCLSFISGNLSRVDFCDSYTSLMLCNHQSIKPKGWLVMAALTPPQL